MKVNSITAFVGGILILAVIIAWRAATGRESESTVHMILYDPSDSKVNGCACLKTYAARLMNEITTKDHVISFSVLGTTETGYQPKVVGSFEIPINDSALSSTKKFEDKKLVLLNDLEGKCNAIPQTHTTPLFQGLQVMSDTLNQKCRPGSGCTLWIQTDLEEIVDERVIRAFRAENTGQPVPVDLPRIDNSKVLTTFSGTTEIIVSPSNKGGSEKRDSDLGKKAKQRLGDLEIWYRVWKRVFTNAEGVRFEPICNG